MTKKEKETCKKYRQRNKKKIRKYQAGWYLKNKEKVDLRNKKYRETHREEIKEYSRKYSLKNRERRAKYKRENREEIAIRERKYRSTREFKDRRNENNLKRKRNDIQYRLSCNIRTRLNKIIKRQQKGGSAIKDLGCSLIELTKHLEKLFADGMNWDNYGKWQLDHIKPLTAFDLTDRKQFTEAVNYKNLQPLWAGDNLAKKDKLLWRC